MVQQGVAAPCTRCAFAVAAPPAARWSCRSSDDAEEASRAISVKVRFCRVAALGPDYERAVVSHPSTLLPTSDMPQRVEWAGDASC